MKVTRPEDKVDTKEKLQEAILKFEEKFEKEEGGLLGYYLIISGEYNRFICDEIEDIYLEAGWGAAICKTSSENGERGGLTGLQLWRA
jgi:hypothetical protein